MVSPASDDTDVYDIEPSICASLSIEELSFKRRNTTERTWSIPLQGYNIGAWYPFSIRSDLFTWDTLELLRRTKNATSCSLGCLFSLFNFFGFLPHLFCIFDTLISRTMISIIPRVTRCNTVRRSNILPLTKLSPCPLEFHNSVKNRRRELNLVSLSPKCYSQ